MQHFSVIVKPIVIQILETKESIGGLFLKLTLINTSTMWMYHHDDCVGIMLEQQLG